jgi:hypothetical protein
MKRNYISSFSEFILEQDMGMSAMPGMPGAAPKKEKPVHFLFMDAAEYDDFSKKKYPDGSIAIDFPCYSATSTDLTDWAKKNIVPTDQNKLSDSTLELRRKNLVDIVKGDKMNISKEDIPFIEKLKNAVSSDMFGAREADVNVLFTKEGEPTTEEVAVTFIKYKK